MVGDIQLQLLRTYPSDCSRNPWRKQLLPRLFGCDAPDVTDLFQRGSPLKKAGSTRLWGWLFYGVDYISTCLRCIFIDARFRITKLESIHSSSTTNHCPWHCHQFTDHCQTTLESRQKNRWFSTQILNRILRVYVDCSYTSCFVPRKELWKKIRISGWWKSKDAPAKCAIFHLYSLHVAKCCVCCMPPTDLEIT